MLTFARVLLAFILLPGLLAPAGFQALASAQERADTQVGPNDSAFRVPRSAFSPSALRLLASLPPGGMARFTITLNGQVDLAHSMPLPAAQAAVPASPGARQARSQAVIQALQSYTAASLQGLLAQAATLQAQGQVGELLPLWISNAVSVVATPAGIQALGARPEVAQVRPDPDPDFKLIPYDEDPAAPLIRDATAFPDPIAQPAGPLLPGTAALDVQPNIALVNAPTVWEEGYTGQGVVVASLDTGVDSTHPSLAASYRGGTDSWFDPYLHTTTPYDPHFQSHGTHTMGIMLGSAGGPDGAIGMAPGARWIAAKIFDDTGGYIEAFVHQAFEWVLDPDGNPATPDGADVVNNSWGYGLIGTCITTFAADITALRAAGVLPIFSAGNSGQGSVPGTDSSPANNPGAFAVAAIDLTSGVWYSSGHGPSACATGQPYPDVAAPGVNILSSVNNSGFARLSGTSMAAPHAAGALALLLSAYPGLSVEQQEGVLQGGAFDLPPTGPDNASGFGRLDVLQSLDLLKNSTSPPFALQATASGPQDIQLHWTVLNPNATGFSIETSPDGLGGWTPAGNAPAGATSAGMSGLAEGQLAYYRVLASYPGPLTSIPSNIAGATTLLFAPSNLTATPVSPTRVELAWSPNSASASAYQVERSPNGSAGWFTLTSLAGLDGKYSDTYATDGTAYFYRVTATNTTPARSAPSNTASAITPLRAPTGITATPLSDRHIDLAWSNTSLNATGLRVERASGAAGPWIDLTLTLLPPSENVFSDASLPGENTTVVYRVTAVNALAPVGAAISAPVTSLLASPTGLRAVPQPGGILITWLDSSAAESGYQVQVRLPADLTWTDLVTTPANASATLWAAPAGAYLVQVRAVAAAPNLSSVFSGPAAVVLGDHWTFMAVSFSQGN